MTNMSKQLESLFKDLSANLNNIEDLEKIDPEELEDMSQDYSEDGMGFPIGSIFANFIPRNSQANEEESNNNSRQKVKVEKKKTNKKKKFLDTYGTNLTLKAKNNQIDMVIGRDKEIQRVIQIKS